MNIEADDIKRLGFEVRRFLSKGNLLTKIAGMGTLYLEFPDVESMHGAHASILRAMSHNMMYDPKPHEYIDDHTIRLSPLFGVVIVLTCKQRFATTMRGSVGYRDIAFNTLDIKE